MKEENKEYLEASNNNGLVEIADALGDDIFYVEPSSTTVCSIK